MLSPPANSTMNFLKASLMNKKCSRCGIEKPLNEFPKNKTCFGGHSGVCKACRYETIKKNRESGGGREKNNEGQRRYRKTDTYKNTRLLRLYGITLKEWQALYDKQEGYCIVCETHQAELTKPLCVDHCHKTNKVRGLLCSHCNTSLGFLKEDRRIVLRLVDYIDSNC